MAAVMDAVEPRRHVFAAMGTSIELVTRCEDESAAAAGFARAATEVGRLEKICSRFLRTSELQTLNRSGQMIVSPELFELIDLADTGREITAGRFDPTVHDAIVRSAPGQPSVPALGAPLGSAVAPWRRGTVRLDSRTRTVSLGAGVKLDLNGVAKGFIADRACHVLSACGACLVNVGGDVSLFTRDGDEPWPVGLGPCGITLDAASGGIATSAQEPRAWVRSGAAGGDLRHLVDPMTGEPTDTDVAMVSVFGESAAEAELWSTAFAISGSEQALLEASQRGIPCVILRSDGRTLLSDPLR